jgi:reverse transcriptase-like protein
MKIDLCKAYDSMNWQFLKEMLVAHNFPHHFIKIIMACITSTSYVLMINGSPTNIFAAKRGLRQGDPLSPLLFVLGMEYLSRSLKSLIGTFGFHPRCKSIHLTHLCFADDLMIFYKGDMSSVRLLVIASKLFPRLRGFMLMPESLISIWLGLMIL